jgi:type I restriction enzyme S subunit
MAKNQTSRGRPEFKDTVIGGIPKEWEVVKIEEICKVRRGASPRPISDPSYFSDKGRGWIRISDVTDTYKYLRNTSQYLSKKGEERSVNVNPGDLIMSICATIGKPIILDMEACIHDGFVWFSELSNDVDVEYLFYALQKNEVIFSSKRQTGTQGNLNTTLVGKTHIPLPPLSEQRRIAEILSTVDEAIQRVDEAIARTERLKRGLMQKLLTRGIGHKEFKNTEIGRIPKEWEVVRVEDIFEVYGGTTPSTSNKEYWNGAIFWVTPTDITNLNEKLDLSETEKKITEKAVKDNSLKTLQPGTLLLTSRATIGFTAINSRPVTINQGMAALIKKNKNIGETFYAYYFSSLRSYLDQLGAGSTFKEVSKSTIKKLKIPLPPLSEQRRIAEILSTVDKKLELEKNRGTKLERIKRGLMSDLLNGKKRVKA